MENLIKEVEIDHFKSIKKAKFQTSRVNVFIGKPNVGKSNVLEAISIFSAGYSNTSPKSFLKDIIRFDKPSQIFFENDVQKDVLVKIQWDKSQGFTAIVRHFEDNADAYELVMTPNTDWIGDVLLKNTHTEFINTFWKNLNSDPLRLSYVFKPDLYIIPTTENVESQKRDGFHSPIKKYYFQKEVEIGEKLTHYLYPPNGRNLYRILDKNKNLSEEIAFIFDSYNLGFTLSTDELNFKIQRKEGLRTWSFPYSSQGDTLQRLVFYFAAIDSNENSVLILEEPEVHAFPPYTLSLGHRIAKDEKNQYFISSHSPYLLEVLLESCDKDDLNIFLVDYKQNETQIHPIELSKIADLVKNGFDIFFNLNELIEEVE